MQLRPYQIEYKEQTRHALAQGHKRVIVCAPTGAGKAVLIAGIGKDVVARGKSFMVLVERTELLKQAADKLIKMGIHPCIIDPNHRQYKTNAYVASVQTLVNRRPPEIDLLIIDECHREIFDKIIQDTYPNVRVVGFTATPIRMSKNYLSKYYTKIIECTTIPELIEEKFLVDAVTFGVPVDVSDIKTKGDDYDETELFRRFDKPQIYNGVIRNYTKRTPGESAICFCINVEHSIRMAKEFKTAGISAAHVDGTTPKAEREKIISAFKAGRIKILCNCDILTFGFDAPIITCVIMNRATQSLALWLQVGGRGSRPYLDERTYEAIPLPSGEMKERFTILDFGTNADRLGVWQADREWTLEPPKKKKEGMLSVAPVKYCPDCEAILAVSARMCKFCGYQYPLEEKDPLPEVELVEVAPPKPPLPEHLKRPWTELSLVELEELRTAKGYKQGWLFRVLSQKGLFTEQTLDEYRKLKGYKHGWVKRQMETFKGIINQAA